MDDNKQKTILLVEDEFIIATVQSKVIQEFGYNVILSVSGEESVQFAAENHSIDLILMDIDLGSGIDGTESAKRILADKKIPIVFLTSHNEQEMVEKVRGITRYGYMVKSSGDFVLRSTIEMAFELFDAHQSIEKNIESLRENQQKLVESKERLDFALSAVNDAIWDYKPIEEALYWSPRYYTMLGYEVDEFSPSMDNWRSLIHPDDLDDFNQSFFDCIGGRADNCRHELRLRTKDGEYLWILIRGNVVSKDENGRVVRIAGTHSDTTGRKLAELSLRESENLLQKAQAMSHIGHFKFNPNTSIIEGSDELFSIFEIRRENFRFSDYVSSVLPEQRDSVVKTIQYAIDHKTSYSIEHYMIVRNGSLKFIKAIGEPAFNDDGSISLMVGTIQDISERKRMEEELRKSEELLAITLNSIGDAVISTDTFGKITKMNPAAEKLTGWSFDEAVNKPLTCVFKIINAENRSIIENPVSKVIEKGEIIGLANHTVLISRSGTEYQISDSAAPIRDKDGIVRGVILVFSDVSDKYKAEQELLESETRLKSIIQSSPMGMHMYELTVDDRLIFTGANPAADKILGVDNSAFVGKTIEEAFPPLIETEVPHQYREVAKNGGTWRTEQISYKDNRISGAFEVVAFQFASQKMAAMFFDSTERKKAEERIQRLLKEKEKLLQEAYRNFKK